MKQKHSIVSGHRVNEDEYFETKSLPQERDMKRQKVISADNYDAFLEGREDNF